MPAKNNATERKRVEAIVQALAKAYPDVRSGLVYQNAFELLIATILSAQCTDKQVNKATPALFKDYPDAGSMALLLPEQLAPYIKSCGFYATKSKNIVAACQRLRQVYGGEVPADIQALMTLPGVGRKTANVVASNAFGVDAIAVDTHVFRVANRLGLASARDVKKTEEQLMRAIPKEKWSMAHHWLIYHGRMICSARTPKCAVCTLAPLCAEYAEKQKTTGKGDPDKGRLPDSPKISQSL